MSRVYHLSFQRGWWVLLIEKKLRDEGVDQILYTHPGTFPLDKIKYFWGEGLRIRLITFGHNMWVVVADHPRPGTKNPAQTLMRTADFPTDQIKKAWSTGYKVSFLDYLDGMWVLITEQVSDTRDQSLSITTSVPQDDIEKLWNQGRRIQTLAYGDGRWVIIAERGDPRISQYFFASTKFPKEKISAWYEDATEIQTICYNNSEKLWSVIGEKKDHNNFCAQELYTDTDFSNLYNELKRRGF
eukprot:TRINITY_DN3124_c0_g1_i4.p1 TRINITY_DN3124_c0_g1~~TRINITY_DN3124_c0_g1_i4.p1  ORF type:complete len:242 (-),score=41.47 TRINITY_DN3124_c0_g1_i4:64-789(-)